MWVGRYVRHEEGAAGAQREPEDRRRTHIGNRLLSFWGSRPRWPSSPGYTALGSQVGLRPMMGCTALSGVSLGGER